MKCGCEEMIVCITEDRASFSVPIKLLLLSLAKHCRDLPVELFFPAADAEFISFLKGLPQVSLNPTPLARSTGWNVKPEAISMLLHDGHDDVLWIDSDIIVTRDFRLEFVGLDPAVLVATEEALWGNYSDADSWRARAWGFEAGRNLPFTVNTGVLRMTRSHLPLLAKWRALMEGDAYRQAQKLSTEERPMHMFGDQDVLTALLSSAEFSDVPLKFLKRGAGIVQYFGLSGYTCAERLHNLLHGPPYFVHSQVFKPWVKFAEKRQIEGSRDLVDALYLDLSPYTLAARAYERSISESCHWMRPQSTAASLLRAAGFWYAPLTGLPIAALADLVRTTNLSFLKRCYFKQNSLRDPAAPQRPAESPRQESA